MDSDNDRKRRFKLFFEYLSRNKQYQDCWQWWKDNFDEKKFDLSALKKNPYHYDSFLYHWAIFGNPLENINIAERYNNYENKGFKCANKINLSQEIDRTEKLYNDCFKIPFKNLQAERVINIIKENLCEPEVFYIKIDIDSNYSIKEITSIVEDIIKRERKIRNIQKARKRNDELDKLERCLKIYDTRETIINRKRMAWRKVYERTFQLYKNLNLEESFTPEAKETLHKDNKKAIAIINNSIKCDDPREFPFKGG